jgi:hypothetical protein
MSPASFATLATTLLLASACQAGILHAASDNYLIQVKQMSPGDTLELMPGEYRNGLPIHGINGRPGQRITIAGPASGPRPVFMARSGANTVSIVDSSYITIRNLELDGLNMAGDAVKAEGHAHWAHHITLENLLIRNHGGDQQTVGISTKCPAWNWVIRNNVIVGAGTGIYLGNSDGSAPFVAGLIEYNLIVDTLGYNLQIKHQQARPALAGMPGGPSATIVRHNVFSKQHGAATEAMARPNVLLGHGPLKGAGADDSYQVYGNFFYDNPSEALFQGEGNIELHHNVFWNRHGDAIHIQPHNDVPKRITLVHNTVLATGTGIRVLNPEGAAHYPQIASANAVFAATPISGIDGEGNITAPLAKAGDYLMHPLDSLGTFDPRPQPGRLALPQSAQAALPPGPHANLDFDGRPLNLPIAGAYNGEAGAPVWLPRLERKRP